MILISFVKIIFYISIGGIFLLLLKRFFTQQEKREKFKHFIKKALYNGKIFSLKLIFLIKKIVKHFNENIKPKIKNAATFTAIETAKFFSRVKNSLQSKTARVKNELKPIHFTKEKKEFFSHLWEKVNKTRKVQTSTSAEKIFQLKSKKEKIPIFTQTSKHQEQTPSLMTAAPQTASVSLKPKEELKRQIVEDPIKKDILIKQEKSLLKLVTLKPKDFNLYKKLGIIYKELGSFEDAKNCFEYALKLGARDKEIQKELEFLNNLPM